MASIKIKVKTPKGKEKVVIVNSTDTIGTAKIKSGYSGYIWKFDGEILKDDKTIEYYQLEEDDTIIINTPQPGGKKFKKKTLKI